MPDPSVSELGQGPGIVLLHGVGVGPESFVELAGHLAARHRVVVLDRPTGSLEGQADAVVETMAAADLGRPLVVGVSGGATLALVLGLRHPEVVGGLVVHEPLLGRLAPALHARFALAADRAASGVSTAVDVVRGVLGERTWAALGQDGEARVVAGAARASAEVPVFAAFDPSAEEIATLRALPILTTVGELSDPDRHEVATVLESLAGADVVSVPDAGNAVQLDAPEAFAACIWAWQQVSCGLAT